MIRSHIISSHLPTIEAEALNLESGYIYSKTLVTHWRVLRHSNHWMSRFGAEKLNDYYVPETDILHSHSIDAAQQGFYKACKTAKACQQQGLDTKYPYHVKTFRTTIWKSSAIRIKNDVLLLSRKRGIDPIKINLPSHLQAVDIIEVRLVFDKVKRYYNWHFVVEDHIQTSKPSGKQIAAIDLGEIHPVAITDGNEVCIFSCRELRSIAQYSAKRQEAIAKVQAKRIKGSIRWKRLQARKVKFLSKQKLKRRDLEHKISHATVKWCKDHNVSTLVIGDIRDIADKTKVDRKLKKPVRQKMSIWPHGKIRNYINYKSEAEGIKVKDKQDEAYTSQTCLRCGKRKKPKGRIYSCSGCGFVFPRDGVGCSNILSKYLFDECGKICPSKVEYRHPWLNVKSRESVVSSDTEQVARIGNIVLSKRESTGIYSQ